MAGTSEGAQKVVAKLKALDPDHYRKIGKLGGQAGLGFRGFARNRDIAREAGRKGGTTTQARKRNQGDNQ